MIKEIIKELKEDCNGLIKPEDNIILESAVKVFISNNIQSSKDKSITDKPTDKQLKILKDYKIKIPNNLTKLEATKIIAELFNTQ